MNPNQAPHQPETTPERGFSPLSSSQVSYRTEITRKAIHLSSIVIPILYLLTPKSVALTICIPLTLLFLIVDVGRYYNKAIEYWFYRLFGGLLRTHEFGHEQKRLNGATYVLIAATVAIFVFPKMIAVTGFLILIISDLTAALVGKRFGRHRFLGKSVEGSAAFFLSALLVVLLTPKVNYIAGEYFIGAVAAAVGTIVEALPIQIDDNLSIPMSVGFTMWAGYALFYPILDTHTFG